MTRRLALLVLLAACSSAPAPTDDVRSIYGRVPVYGHAAPLVIDGDTAWGAWNGRDRLILIDTSASPDMQWVTRYHEACHVALDDAGVEVGASLVERVCDAIAMQRLAEHWHAR